MKFKITIYVLFLLLIITITACDDRGSDNPTMDIAVADTFVYNEGNLNVLEFEVQLDGANSKISERKVLVDFNDRYGVFIGNGSSNYMRTDINGFASGRFVANDTTGVANIDFTLETWPSQQKHFSIEILDLPRLDSLVAGTNTLTANGISSTSLKAYISSLSDNLDGMNILFETSHGTLQHVEVETDDEGIAYNNIIAPNEECLMNINARLELSPTRYKSTNISCTNRK